MIGRAAMNTQKSKSEFRFTGFHMAACMAAFFGVIIAVNLTMASFASSSWTGLVVKNSYVASQKFNTELAEAEAQSALGWKSDIVYENRRLMFGLTDQTGRQLAPQNVILSIGRPAFEQKDQKLQLTAAQSGLYGSPLELEDGTWMLRLDADVGDKKYRRDLRMFVKHGTGRIE